MATIEVKGEIVGLVFQNKGVQILETFKSKDGEKRDARYTAWLDSPTSSLQIGQKVSARGLLSASIGNYKNKEGEEKTVVNLSINFATIKLDGSEAPAMTATHEEALPF
jgi:hypothetical protein